MEAKAQTDIVGPPMPMAHKPVALGWVYTVESAQSLHCVLEACQKQPTVYNVRVSTVGTLAVPRFEVKVYISPKLQVARANHVLRNFPTVPLV